MALMNRSRTAINNVIISKIHQNSQKNNEGWIRRQQHLTSFSAIKEKSIFLLKT